MPRMSREARQTLRDVPPLRVGGTDLVEGDDRIMRTSAEHQTAGIEVSSEEGLERQKVRESFKQEALASWTHFKETGRHLTGDEVHAWLNTWGTKYETAAPACHG